MGGIARRSIIQDNETPQFLLFRMIKKIGWKEAKESLGGEKKKRAWKKEQRKAKK